MESAVGMRQYGKFVETMLYRICAEESDPDEFRAFVDLIATDVNRKFLEVALRHLPDLCEEQTCNANNRDLDLLLQMLRTRVKLKSSLNNPPPSPRKRWSYEQGLSPKEHQMIKDQMLGTHLDITGTKETDSMKRVFKSTMELAWPQVALDNALADAKKANTDIKRDHQGLPFFMQLSEPAPRSHEPAREPDHHSITHFWTPGGARLSTKPAWSGTMDGQLALHSPDKASIASTRDGSTDDNSTLDLLTNTELEGVDNPRLLVSAVDHTTTPSIIQYAEPNHFSEQVDQLQRKPAHRLVPSDAPPALVRTDTERDVWRAIRRGSPRVVLNYFASLPSLPASPLRRGSRAAGGGDGQGAGGAVGALENGGVSGAGGGGGEGEVCVAGPLRVRGVKEEGGWVEVEAQSLEWRDGKLVIP
ncbi:hypothetical protein MMC21_005155 [Puttea exsequens]|nr:hypothetical protein [Puttea exsequens]